MRGRCGFTTSQLPKAKSAPLVRPDLDRLLRSAQKRRVVCGAGERFIRPRAEHLLLAHHDD
jgi:hypothetical protein